MNLQDLKDKQYLKNVPKLEFGEHEEVKAYIQEQFALSIDDDGYIEAKPPEAIITLDGKHHFTADTIGIEHYYHINKYDVASHMDANEVCEDIKTFITRVHNLFE